jgi:hypothetical protein
MTNYLLRLTSSERMALMDLITANLVAKQAVQVYVDVVRGVETTVADLLDLVAKAPQSSSGSETMSSNPELLTRLRNWEFQSAADLLDADDLRERAQTVRALARLYGNSGRFEGETGEFVGAVVTVLLRDDLPW